MSKHYIKVFIDDFNAKEWEDLTPDEIHHIDFKGKLFDEVKHGRWIDKGSLSCRCSECGCKSPKEYNYCPNCGAKMEVEE